MVGGEPIRAGAALGAVLLIAASVAGCATGAAGPPVDAGELVLDDRSLPPADLVVRVPGLSRCTGPEARDLPLDSSSPVTVIVHGCQSSAGKYLALAQVFAFHGQQTVCFNYDDRDSMMRSSGELIDALSALSGHLGNPDITVIGHSQGGLVARKALTRERERPLAGGDLRLRLVTVSAPFAGVESARFCGSFWHAVLTLGLTYPICRSIAGDKWDELPPQSEFMTEPGTLVDEVTAHVKVVTDERGSCRRFDPEGGCLEDDFVFSVAEQYQHRIDRSRRTNNIEVRAGHVEIVGDERLPPLKLIRLLQDEGILAGTRPEDRARFSRLLSRLY